MNHNPILIVLSFLLFLSLVISLADWLDRIINKTGKPPIFPVLFRKVKHFKKYIVLISIPLCFLFLLAVHIVPSDGALFFKDHLSFRYTIITEDDIFKIRDEYNSANEFEKNPILKSSIFKTLHDKGYIKSADTKNE